MTSQQMDNADLQKRLLTYSAAASLAVAGGLMTPVSISRAQTPYICQTPGTVADGSGTIDIDFDGSDPEFTVHVEAYDAGADPRDWARVFLTGDGIGSDQGLRVMGAVYGNPSAWLYASALTGGVTVSANAGLETMSAGNNPSGGALLAREVVTYTTPLSSNGAWLPNSTMPQVVKYLGLEFDLSGSTYYGWARLIVEAGTGDLDDDPHFKVTLDEHCYNPSGGSAGTGAPSAVQLADADAASESRLPAALAALFTGLAGLFLSLRRRLVRRRSGRK